MFPASIKLFLVYYVVQHIFSSLGVVTENYPDYSGFHCATSLENHPTDELIQLIIKTHLNAYSIFHAQGLISICKLYFEDHRQKSVSFCSRAQQLITILMLIIGPGLQQHIHISFPICSAERVLRQGEESPITTVFLGALPELLCFWDLHLSEAVLCFFHNISHLDKVILKVSVCSSLIAAWYPLQIQKAWISWELSHQGKPVSAARPLCNLP